ncbi:MAG: hypothetical protein ACLUGA_13135 [Oscillospiraceae bacterium]
MLRTNALGNFHYLRAVLSSSEGGIESGVVGVGAVVVDLILEGVAEIFRGNGVVKLTAGDIGSRCIANKQVRVFTVFKNTVSDNCATAVRCSLAHANKRTAARVVSAVYFESAFIYRVIRIAVNQRITTSPSYGKPAVINCGIVPVHNRSLRNIFKYSAIYFEYAAVIIFDGVESTAEIASFNYKFRVGRIFIGAILGIIILIAIFNHAGILPALSNGHAVVNGHITMVQQDIK